MASPIVLEVLQIIDNMKEESNLFNDVEGDLAELKQTLLRIQSVLPDGEKREMIEEPVRRWLREVKDAAYYAEDFFDDCRNQQRNTHEVCCPTTSLSDRIIKIIETLRKIASEIDNLSLKVGVVDCTVKPMSHVRDGSHDVESAVFGREDEKERIIEFLLSARVRRSRLSVVSIVGAAGAGKSTLAELIYDDPRVCGHFERIGWVCVSQDFNLLSITSSLVKSLGYGFVDSEGLAYLQVFVKQYLVDTRFLLVFDDVWNVDERRWKILQSPLTVGLEGSAIIITTREKSVAAIMEPVQTYVLGCIAEEDCWLLLKQHAFAGKDTAEHPSMVGIAKKLVERCRSMPLSAKLVGGLLGSDFMEEKWKDILASDLWESDKVKDDILPALRLSYYHLPPQLKQCFAYCSLFPKGFLFEKNRLIRLWLAQGFIMSEGKKKQEDIAGEYFDELLRRSFFQFCPSKYSKQTYIIQNLVHDLAELVSAGEISRVEDCNLWYLPTEARHSSLVLADSRRKVWFQIYGEPRNMRTFLVVNRLLDLLPGKAWWGNNILRIQIPSNMFYYLTCLQALDLSGSNIKSLSDSIGNLKYLRYLGLRRTKIRNLPESICSLSSLQTLELTGCVFLQELPKSFKNLTDLRHLLLPKRVFFPYMPIGVGKLTNLQTLTTFCVGPDKGYCGVGELKDLAHIRGKLCIAGLDNIVNAEDAKEADLKSKRYIEKLKLLWCYGGPAYLSEGEEEEIDEGEHDDGIYYNKIVMEEEDGILHDEVVDEEGGSLHGFRDKSNSDNISLSDEEVESVDTKKETANVDAIEEALQDDRSSCLENVEADKWIHNINLTDEAEDNANADILLRGSSNKCSNENKQCIQNITLFDEVEPEDDKKGIDIGDAIEEVVEDERTSCISIAKDSISSNEIVKKKLLDLRVLESLEANTNLTNLIIRNYDGIQFPKWIGDSSFSKLVSVTLESCCRCEILPPLGQLPSLKYLCMVEFYLKRIDQDFYGPRNSNLEKAFPMLETLSCESFYRLEEWVGAKDGAFPRLRYLKFGSCFNLKSLTGCFPLLKKLVIMDCSELMVLPAVPSLTHLELHYCNKEIWSSLPQELLHRLLVLGISGSEDLPSLPFQNLSSLKKLEIEFCQKHARNNSSLCLHRLMFLECLKVSYCPNLWFAQEDLLPPTLKELNIFQSPLLATWCRSHARSKLQYVSEIIIDKRELYPIDDESVNDEIPCRLPS